MNPGSLSGVIIRVLQRQGLLTSHRGDSIQIHPKLKKRELVLPTCGSGAEL